MGDLGDLIFLKNKDKDEYKELRKKRRKGSKDSLSSCEEERYNVLLESNCWRQIGSFANLGICMVAAAFIVLIPFAFVSYLAMSLVAEKWVEFIGTIILIVFMIFICFAVPINIARATNHATSPDYKSLAFNILTVFGIYMAVFSLLVSAIF